MIHYLCARGQHEECPVTFRIPPAVWTGMPVRWESLPEYRCQCQAVGCWASHHAPQWVRDEMAAGR